jgi:hypothetical protein
MTLTELDYQNTIEEPVQNSAKKLREGKVHQEDHTFLFWLYKAVIRSKKTKS